MTEPRDHCPDCGHKLHPQELEILFRGRKLDCWYCRAPLKAQAMGRVPMIAQGVIAAIPFIDTLVSDSGPAWSGYAFAAVILAAIHVLPPGLVHGASWVRIVNKRSLFAVEDE